MEQPGFCSLLKLGSVLCIIGTIAGSCVLLLGLACLEQNPSQATTLIIMGIASALQSLVGLGILKALLWIVDQLLGRPSAEASSVHADTPPEKWL